MLKQDLRPGEELQIGDAIVKLVKKSGQVASLVISAPRSVQIKRVSTAEEPAQEVDKAKQKPFA